MKLVLTVQLAVAFFLLPLCGSAATLGSVILSDSRLESVAQQARTLLRTGFTAGGGYNAVFIRDYNTFLNGSCEVNSKSALKAHLVPFLMLQRADGSIDDLYADTVSQRNKKGPIDGITHGRSDVPADQESSLVQAVFKYVKCTGDRGFLKERVAGRTVLERLSAALEYVRLRRFDARYALIVTGAAIDWGDVAPEADPGENLDAKSHLAASIYPNAMYAVAIGNFIDLDFLDSRRRQWLEVRRSLVANIRRLLWDPIAVKFRPHLYIGASPFPKDFDEERVVFEGGTAVAIEAEILSPLEIRQVNDQLLMFQKDSGAYEVAGSVYPPYPIGLYKNPIMCEFCYQNGALWPWFAARMVRQNALHGLLQEAYDEIQPMLDQVLKFNDFSEYYTLGNHPEGSSQYKGSAGVLLDAIETLERLAPAARGEFRASSPMRGGVNAGWSYRNLPVGYAWAAETDRKTGDIVYYGKAPSYAQPPLSPGASVYVGPDSVFYFFSHAPPIMQSDLVNIWTPGRSAGPSLPAPAVRV